MKKMIIHIVLLGVCVLMIDTIVNTLFAQDVKTINDRDGNTYKTVKIGNQIWMVENLKTTKFKDGTPIPLVTDNKAWNNRSSPGYCWYNNDTSINRKMYGALYNWFTVATGNLCPAGWHVPGDAEWNTLTDSLLGGTRVAGGKLKEAGTSHWNKPNTGATNETGFAALPGGYRLNNGIFCDILNYGFWWSSSEFFWNITDYFTEYGWGRYMGYYLGDVYRYYFIKKYGFSVRCLKD
jgi:uncharacterized protein (TIGR02145 family)